MKKWDLFNGCLMAVLGLLIIIFPRFWRGVVVVVLGLGAIVYGIYNLKINKAVSDKASYSRAIVIKAVVSIIMGVCAIIFPFAFMSLGDKILRILSWILFAYLIVSAVLGFYASALLRNTGIDRKKYILENISLLVLAIVLLLISPKSLGNTIIIIIGIVLLLLGIALIVYSILVKKTGAADVVVEDAVVVDDEESEEPKTAKKSSAKKTEAKSEDEDSDK